jgi:hypothetical protein
MFQSCAYEKIGFWVTYPVVWSMESVSSWHGGPHLFENTNLPEGWNMNRNDCAKSVSEATGVRLVYFGA